VSKNRARLLVFWASAAVLVLEILAGRLMAPYVGVSLETFTGIIGTILAGIAIGAAVGGRLSDQYDPRRMIGPALMIGGALSWWSLWIVGAIGASVGSGPLAIITLSAVAFVAPTMVLSAVPPMATKLRLRSIDETGTVVGDLSAAGTAGAIFGTFVTGFVLVSALPTRPIVLALGGALVVAGIALTLWGTRTLPGTAAVVMVILSAGAGVIAESPCEFESAYFCGRVETDPDDESVRYLVLDTLRHAAVDLDDPTNLEFRYIRLIADVIDATHPDDVQALHIGGGGFSVPQWIDATRPGSTNTVLEIDETLIDVAVDDLGLVLDDDLTVRIGDARLALDDYDDGEFDVVVGDVFGPRSPECSTTTGST